MSEASLDESERKREQSEHKRALLSKNDFAHAKYSHGFDLNFFPFHFLSLSLFYFGFLFYLKWK